MDTTQKTQYTVKDFRSDQLVRWCPGCGDYAILAAMQKVMADMGVARKTVVVSGIMLIEITYYVNSYGFHGLMGEVLPSLPA